MVATTEKKHVLPHNLEAELACLGTVILKNNLFDHIFPKLKPEDFYDGRNRIIAKALVEYRQEEGEAPFDIVTIGDILKKKEILDKAGGMSYVSNMIDSVPTTSNIDYYADIIKEKANLRFLIDICGQIIDRSLNQDDSKEILENFLQNLFDLSVSEYREYEHIKIPLVRSIEFLENNYRNRQVSGILSGFRELDNIIVGFQKANLIILGGRTGMGKTALALNMIERIAMGDPITSYLNESLPVTQNFPTGVFSLEMSKSEICMRFMASQTGTTLKELRKADIPDHKWQSLIDFVDKVKNTQIYIDDTPGITIQELSSKAKKMKKEGVNIIIVDYLQLINVSDSRIPREQQISLISKQLKNLARELDIPVIALTQLNRSADNRDDKTPRLSDIRESGAIEQDADLVLFISEGQDKQDNEEEEEDYNKQIKRITVAKNRHGATGSLKLTYEGKFLRFSDFTP